jgi:hypothetical protein
MPALAVFLSLGNFVLRTIILQEKNDCTGKMNVSITMKTFLLGAGDTENTLVPFLSGILLGNDQQTRNWFSLYVRNGQKVRDGSNGPLSPT